VWGRRTPLLKVRGAGSQKKLKNVVTKVRNGEKTWTKKAVIFKNE